MNTEHAMATTMAYALRDKDARIAELTTRNAELEELTKIDEGYLRDQLKRIAELTAEVALRDGLLSEVLDLQKANYGNGARTHLCLESWANIARNIFSQGLGAGPWHFVLPDGRAIDPCGLAAALVSLSARQVKALGLKTSGICGPPGSTSSRSADLQSSLESRLQARLLSLGSTLYTLTWKEWATPSGVSRFRLRASARRTSETGRIGSLPTPTARDFRGAIGMDNLRRRMNHPRGVNLQEFMQRAVGRPGYLNPDLARLLMGYPAAWGKHAPTAMPSSRSKPRSSSKRTAKQSASTSA